jgi:uncharacterized protein YacL
MPKFFVKLILVCACSLIGYLIALQYYNFPLSLSGLFLGLLIAFMVLKTEQTVRNFSLPVIFGGMIGSIIGLIFSYFLILGLRFIPGLDSQQLIPWTYIFGLLALIFCYLGLVLGAKKGEEIRVPNFILPRRKSIEPKILDTSVIIDGRMSDICDTGFIEGTLIVPRFVLDELQLIADSSDPMKRSRGRRGLDILNKMQKSSGIKIKITDTDFPKLKGVDAKLVALAKKQGGKIITNDYNLNKVAELQGIKILNVNELANALKPLVLPGEAMTVKAIKEGKEPGQGVAYLDDGTMVIVDQGSKYLKQNVEVIVTSVLQTTAGRMIFSAVKN